MKIEIEKKITITPIEGEPVIPFAETIAAESVDISTVLDMIMMGDDEMNREAKESLTLAIGELIIQQEG